MKHTYDVVILNQTLHHIGKPLEFLQSLLTILSKDGFVLIRDHEIANTIDTQMFWAMHYVYDMLENKDETSKCSPFPLSKLKKWIGDNHFVFKRQPVIKRHNWLACVSRKGKIVTNAEDEFIEFCETKIKNTSSNPISDSNESREFPDSSVSGSAEEWTNMWNDPILTTNKVEIEDVPSEILEFAYKKAPVITPLPKQGVQPVTAAESKAPIIKQIATCATTEAKLLDSGPQPKLTPIPDKVAQDVKKAASPAVTTDTTTTVGKFVGQVSLPKDVGTPLSNNKWHKQYTYQIPNDAWLIEYCTKNSIKYATNKSIGNTHPKSAFFRELILIDGFLKRVAKGPCHILDYYGSTRTTMVTANGTIQWTNGPMHTIAGDSARGFKRSDLTGLLFDHILIQDVYQEGPTHLKALSPDTIKHLLDYSKNGVHIIARPFFGQAGCDSLEYDEAFWVRGPDVMIRSWPDPHSSAYASHPDINWLWCHRSVQGVDIAHLATYGPYHLFCLTRTPLLAQPLGDITPPTGLVENIPFDSWGLAAWHNWIPNSLLNKVCGQYLVYLPILAEKNNLFNCKLFNGMLLDTARSTVHACAQEDVFLRRLKAKHPDMYLRVVDGTSFALLYHKKHQTVNHLAYLTSAHQSTERELAQLRTTKDYTPWHTAAVGAAMVVAGLMAGYVLVKRPAGSFRVLRTVAKAILYCVSPTAASLAGAFSWGSKWVDFPDLETYLPANSPSTTLDFLETYIGNFASVVSEWWKPNRTTLVEHHNAFVDVLNKQLRPWTCLGAPLMGVTVYAIAIAPAFEEWLRKWPLLSGIQYLGELYERYAAGNKAGLYFSAIFHPLMALATKLGVSCGVRVSIHSAWNSFAMLGTLYSSAEKWIILNEMSTSFFEKFSKLTPTEQMAKASQFEELGKLLLDDAVQPAEFKVALSALLSWGSFYGVLVLAFLAFLVEYF